MIKTITFAPNIKDTFLFTKEACTVIKKMRPPTRQNPTPNSNSPEIRVSSCWMKHLRWVRWRWSRAIASFKVSFHLKGIFPEMSRSGENDKKGQTRCNFSSRFGSQLCAVVFWYCDSSDSTFSEISCSTENNKLNFGRNCPKKTMFNKSARRDTKRDKW